MMWRRGQGWAGWGRRRYRRYAGRDPRPDQQDGAGRVVHDEPGLPAQALRAQAGLVAVPRHDEQVRLSRGCHHHPFGPALELNLVTGLPDPLGGRLEQAAGRLLGLLRQPGRGVPATAAEQAGVGAAGRVRRRLRGDVQQREAGTGRSQAQGRVHGRRPGSLANPDIYRTGWVSAIAHRFSASQDMEPSPQREDPENQRRGHGQQTEPREFPEVGR